MTDYLLKKDKKKWKIEKLVSFDGIHMQPKLKKHETLMEIQDLTIIDDEMKKEFLMKQFNRQYRKLVAIMLDIVESNDTSTTDCAIALNEISKVRGIIERKLAKELQQKEVEKLQKKLNLIEGKIKNKFLEIQANEMIKSMMMPQSFEEERGKSR